MSIDRLPPEYEAECDECGAIEHSRDTMTLAREGWSVLSEGKLRAIWHGLAHRPGRVVCPACRAQAHGVSHDPLCYGCLGTGKVVGFGHDGARCPCMDCAECGEQATGYDEGRPWCPDCNPNV